MNTISATGHRPTKLGGYGDFAFQRLVTIAYEHLHEQKPDLVISGMALGWDQAVATAAIELGIPFDAYCPCFEQDSKWPAKSRHQFEGIIAHARKTHFTHKGTYPGAWCMQKRNEDMVDATTMHVMAMWDGSSGGTGNCVEYATRQRKPIINLIKELK